MTWNELLKSKPARWAIAFCLLCLLMVIFYLPHFYGYVIEPKPGIYVNDIFLNLFTPYNWSVLIFSLIYISIIQTIFSVARYPYFIVLGLTTYFVVTLIRMGTMYFITLEPPVDMIFLSDPLSTKFYPNGTFAKDMFFSGHVSTMMVLVLVEKNRWVRITKIVFTFTIGVLLAWQHVHYTIDILVAPVVTTVVFYSLKNILGRSIKG